MHFAMSVPQLLIVFVIVVLIFGTRRLRGSNDDLFRAQLQKELGRMPLYSAETTNGKEAEFIRDRLPKRFPTAAVLVVVALLGAILWWLTR